PVPGGDPAGDAAALRAAQSHRGRPRQSNPDHPCHAGWPPLSPGERCRRARPLPVLRRSSGQCRPPLSGSAALPPPVGFRPRRWPALCPLTPAPGRNFTVLCPRCGTGRCLNGNSCRADATPANPLPQRSRGRRGGGRNQSAPVWGEAHLRQSGTVDLFGVDSIELVLLGALALLLLAALGRSLWKRRLQRLRDKDQLILLFTDATAARAEPSAVAPTPFRSSPLGPAVPAAENEPVLVPRPTPVPMERTAGSDNGVAPAPAAPDESGL